MSNIAMVKQKQRIGSFFILSAVCLAFAFLFLSSCKKDKLITDASAKLEFNTDSVLFDTVFTTIGSATRYFLVYNNSSQRIKISNIRFEKGNASPYIINVDGLKGKEFNDIEIPAKDSIFVFVQVNINPTNINSPLIVSDKVVFTTNGNVQNVNLEAWGQDAYYHIPDKAIKFKGGGFLAYSTIAAQNNTTVTWTNDKPHVVYGWLVVDSTQTLIMNAGTKVYLHQNAGLWVYRYGTIKVNGTKGSEVIFQGTRREAEYADEPGQWDRIWINEGSASNVINYAIIKNSFIGIQTEVLGAPGITLTPTFPPRQLSLTNTKIANTNKWGIYSVFYNINAGNTLVSNTKEECLRIELGGMYSFRHCTFANYWEKKGTRERPCVYVANYVENSVFPMDSLYFSSSIIYGKLGNELELDLNTTNVNFPPKYTFINSILKTGGVISGVPNYTNNVNVDPGFKTPEDYNFELPSSFSFTFSNVESGNAAQRFPSDLNGAIRNSPHNPGVYVKGN
jgi:hypothetical protein